MCIKYLKLIIREARNSVIIFDSEWAESKNSFWYAYGTLLGESITRDTNSSKAPALRYISYNSKTSNNVISILDF